MYDRSYSQATDGKNVSLQKRKPFTKTRDPKAERLELDV